MKCPLSNYILEKDDADNEMLVTDCLKEECAWWTPWDKSCAMLTVARHLGSLKDEVDNLVSKMPHEEQFRR